MLQWIGANLGTILICLVLLAIITFIVHTLFQQKKQGKSSCGCKRAHCPMAGSCHKK